VSTPRWLKEDRVLAADGWRHGWTTTEGPDFRAGPGTPAMKAAMAVLGRGTRLAALAWVHQVHGGTVLRARGPGLVGDADALWTTEPDLATGDRGRCSRR
jgi:copper oxidase (laccase) domain-containing protein